MIWRRLRRAAQEPLTRAAVTEVAIVVALFSAAAWTGSRFITEFVADGHRPVYYQSYFEPAVMMTCGHGFAIASPEIPALQSFLHEQVDAFSCDAIPPDSVFITDGLAVRAWYYLMLLIATAWSVVGISWSALTPLYGLVFGLVIVLAYGIFRLGMGRVLAALCSSALIVSALHLLNLPHLRDYLKAPFVLALVLILAWLITIDLKRWQLLALAAAYGVVLGIGYGVRTDLLANIPPFLLVVVAFLPGSLRARVGLKVTMVCLCAAMFVGAAWPALKQVATGGGCQWHVALLGLDADFDEPLGVERPFYQWTAAYSDEYIHTAVTSHANRGLPSPQPIGYCTPEYDAATGDYLLNIATVYPADMAIRAWGSVLHIVDLPFGWPRAPLPDRFHLLYAGREHVLTALAGSGAIAVALTMVLLGSVSLRLGLAALCFVMYFGGYPALQFANRHFFHLEFIGWFGIGFLLHVAWLLLRGYRPWEQNEGWRPPVMRAVAFATTALVLIVGSVWTLRAVQSAQVERLVRGYLDSPAVAIPAVRADDEQVFAIPDGQLTPIDRDPFRGTLLLVELDPEACPDAVTLATRYDTANRPYDFSRVLSFQPDGTMPTTVVVPVYRYFQGFDLGTAPASCLVRVARIEPPHTGTPWVVLTLAEHWADQRHFQQIAEWFPYRPDVRRASE